MNKKFRKIAIMALGIILSAVIFTGCDQFYITSNKTNVLKRADSKTFTVEKAVVEEITKIDINTRLADVELIPSDDYYVEIDYTYWEDTPIYTLENGVLSFDDEASFPHSYSLNFSLNNVIKIYLPENVSLDRIQLDNSSGDIEIAGITVNDLEANVSYGDLTVKSVAAAEAEFRLSCGSSNITDFSAGKLDYTNSYGHAKFTNINTEEITLPDNAAFDTFKANMSCGDMNIKNLYSNSVDVSNSYGDVDCDGITAEEFDAVLSCGDLFVTNADLKDIKANNSYGDVTLSLKGAKEDYSLDLGTSYGKIEVDGKKYEDHLSLDNDGSGKISSDLSSGNIEIEFGIN